MRFLKLPALDDFAALGSGIQKNLATGLFLFFLLFLVLLPTAQASKLFDPFKDASDIPVFKFDLSAAANPIRVQPGEQFKVHVRVKLGEGWHIYSLYNLNKEEAPWATEISLNDPLFQEQGSWTEPPPKITFDGALGKVVKTHSHFIEFTQTRRVPAEAKPGDYPLSGVIIFRACDNKVCALPRKVDFHATVQVRNNLND